MTRCVTTVLVVTALAAALALAPSAVAQVQPYGTNDYGGFRNILPPGTNGFDDAAQLAQFEAGTLQLHSGPRNVSLAAIERLKKEIEDFDGLIRVSERRNAKQP